MKKNKRLINRYFTAILYEEDPNFNKIFMSIMENYKEVTWIEHNRDINEERRNKKTAYTYNI